MIKIKNDEELEGMRAAGRVTAQVRDAVRQKVAPGLTTGDLDVFAAQLISDLGGESAFLGYRGFPGHICSSVNDEIVHGIPGQRVIEIGDIVSLDFGVRYQGFIGDTAVTVMVGVTDPEVMRLLKVTEEALQAAIEQAVEGNRLSDISHAVEKVALKGGFSVVRDFVGHGIGREMHEDPQIPNYGPPNRGPRLKAGMTFALEPMINLGAPEVEVLDDGWTVLTKDRKPSAHFEHTVAVGKNTAEILTPRGNS
jgi:methionyl aminopeptidase